jgi:hypothetical protein
MRPDPALQRFVRGLIGGAAGSLEGQFYTQPDGRRVGRAMVEELVRSGAIIGDGQRCAAGSETLSWLKRARLDADAFAAQHRVVGRDKEGREINFAESPLSRLVVTAGPAFLERHHIEAGERVRKLVERAQLQPRLTMAYTAARIAGGTPAAAGDISDLAVDARRALDALHANLPRDCAGVVIDVCGLLKGLQQVERERGWPRRSAKLVLRIGLEQLAAQFGLTPLAVGQANRRPRNWMEKGSRPLRLD